MKMAIPSLMAMLTMVLAGCAPTMEDTVLPEAEAEAAEQGPAPATVIAGKLVYDAAPRYPATQINLEPEGLVLLFRAGGKTDDYRRPVIGPNGVRTTSGYSLLSGAPSRTLVTAPSLLSDPRQTPGSGSDGPGRLQVFVSESGGTILVREDSSIVLPNVAYLLFQEDFAHPGRWHSSELRISHEQVGDLAASGPLAYAYPEVRGITDGTLHLGLRERQWSLNLTSIQRRNKQTGTAADTAPRDL